MIAVTSQTRIWVAVEPADFRCGIDGLARVCRQKLSTERPQVTDSLLNEADVQWFNS